MAVIVKRSPVPYYAAAAVWVLWSLLFPLYRILHFAALLALSGAAFGLARLLVPNRTIQVPDPTPPPEPVSEDDAAVAQLRSEGARAVAEMRRLSVSIGGALTAQIAQLEQVTEKIIEYVAARPEKMGQIQRFLNYYLPTVLKLLGAYDRMDDAGVRGVNIDTTKGRIEDILSDVAQAFDKQLEALFADETLDVSTDITVLEQMLAREGLGDTQLPI